MIIFRNYTCTELQRCRGLHMFSFPFDMHNAYPVHMNLTKKEVEEGEVNETISWFWHFLCFYYLFKILWIFFFSSMVCLRLYDSLMNRLSAAYCSILLHSIMTFEIVNKPTSIKSGQLLPIGPLSEILQWQFTVYATASVYCWKMTI